MRRRLQLVLSTGLVLVLVLGAGRAAAQPTETVELGGDSWTHVIQPGVDVFTRADGAKLEVRPASLPCARQLRAAEARRYDWLPRVYWPTLDTGAGIVTLCLEGLGGTVAVVVQPGKGKAVGADLAHALTEIAVLVRSPTEVPSLGAIHPSLPIVQVRGDDLALVIDGQPVGIGLVQRPVGSCAYDHARVAVKRGPPSNVTFADGYWPTVFTSERESFGCLDLQEGYLTVFVTPSTALPAVADVLAEIRAVAYARHGAPITSATDPMTLPHTRQAVSAQDGGSWKVVDGERFKLPGADVLVSIAPLSASTMFVIAVSEGPCAPGTTAAPPDVAGRLVPTQLGAVWLDDAPYQLRWRAWACLTSGGATATITVLGPLAGNQPPADAEAASLAAMVTRIARSYGLDIPLPAPLGTGTVTPPWTPAPSRSSRRRARASAAGYAGIISLAPGAGDRRTGALVGFNMRIAAGGVGGVLAFDLELGYGGGEGLGEVRTGVGLTTGTIDAIIGVSAGSIGPGAALDVYGEVSVSAMRGRTLLWLGAMHAIGVAGPDHEQLELRATVTGKDETGLYVGARAMFFGDDSATMMDTGSALLLTFGGGVAARGD